MFKHQIFWFYTGQSLFGLLIGLLLGLSVSPIVGTVVGLLFGFIGGSIIVLIKDRSEKELSVIGVSISMLSLFMIPGILIGVYSRANDILYLESPNIAPYLLSEPLQIDDLIELAGKEEYSGALCSLIRKSTIDKNPASISKNELSKLIDAGVNPAIIKAMFDSSYQCRTDSDANRVILADDLNADSRTVLYLDSISLKELKRIAKPLPNRLTNDK